jgi:hypothetical protein
MFNRLSDSPMMCILLARINIPMHLLFSSHSLCLISCSIFLFFFERGKVFKTESSHYFHKGWSFFTHSCILNYKPLVLSFSCIMFSGAKKGQICRFLKVSLCFSPFYGQ